jgi:hypothetical protein
MRHVIPIIFACILPLSAPAEEADINLVMSKRDLVEPLHVYQRLSGKPVFTAVPIAYSRVTIASDKMLNRAEALEFIRKSLLENYGIETRSGDQGETLVFASKDPKYPFRTDPPVVSSALPPTKEETGEASKRRIQLNDGRSSTFAEEDKVKMLWSKCHLSEVLYLYQTLSGKPVYMDLSVMYCRVTIAPGKTVTKTEALELIRNTLLETYGIELRTNDQGETLVSASKDPKRPLRFDPPIVSKDPTETKQQSDGAQQKRRVRVIDNPLSNKSE